MDFDALLNLIISIVSGFLGGYFSIYLKESSDAKKNHLDTLKLKVLEPINEAIGRIPESMHELSDKQMDKLTIRKLKWILKISALYLSMGKEE